MSMSETPLTDAPVEGVEGDSFSSFVERHRKLLKLLEERSAAQAQLHAVRSRLEIAYGIGVPRRVAQQCAHPTAARAGCPELRVLENPDDAQQGFSRHTERRKDEEDGLRGSPDTSLSFSEGRHCGVPKQSSTAVGADSPVLRDAGTHAAMDKLFLETEEDRAHHEYLVYQKQRTLLRVEGLREELRRWEQRRARVRHAAQTLKRQYKEYWKGSLCEDRCTHLAHSLAETESGIQVSLKRLAQQICRIFHLKLEESAPATLRGFDILRADEYFQRLEALTSSELWVIGTSLGFLTHMAWLLARYLCAPLPALLEIRSSRSSLRSRPPRAWLGYIAVAVDVGAHLRLPLDDVVSAAVLAGRGDSGGVKPSASCATVSAKACRALQPFYVSCAEKTSDPVEALQGSGAGPLQTRVVLRGPMLVPFVEMRDGECGQQPSAAPEWLIHLGLMSRQSTRGRGGQAPEAESPRALPASGGALLAVSWSALVGGGSRSGAAEAPGRRAPTLPSPPPNVLLPLLSVGGVPAPRGDGRAVSGPGSPSRWSEARLPLYIKSNTASHRAQFGAALDVLQSTLAQLARAYAGISRESGSVWREPDSGAPAEGAAARCDWVRPDAWPTLLFPVRRILAQEVRGAAAPGNDRPQTER